MKVHYPKTSSFGEVVHWLDAAYALDTASWSKHASICLTSHDMNLLVLYLDTKSIKKTQKYANAIAVFKESIDRILSTHDLKVIPVIYPANKLHGFDDETQRLDEVLGIDFGHMQMPQIGLIHGHSKT